MNKAALGLFPALILVLAAPGRVNRAAAEGALPCNTLCRAWMGVSEPEPPPPAMIDLHPAPDAVDDEPPLPPSPRLRDPGHRAMKEAAAAARPKSRSTEPKSLQKIDHAVRGTGVPAALRAAASRSTPLPIPPRPAAARPLVAVAIPAAKGPALVLLPTPTSAVGVAPEPEIAATGLVGEAVSAVAKPPVVDAVPGALAGPERPAVLAQPAALEPPTPADPMPAIPVTAAAQEPAAPREQSTVAAPRPALTPDTAPPAAVAAAPTGPAPPAALEAPRIVAALGSGLSTPGEAPMATKAPGASPPALTPVLFPPALDVIATLMLTTPVRR